MFYTGNQFTLLEVDIRELCEILIERATEGDNYRNVLNVSDLVMIYASLRSTQILCPGVVQISIVYRGARSPG